MHRHGAGGCTGNQPGDVPAACRRVSRHRAGGGVSPHLLCGVVPLRTYYVKRFFVPTCAQPCSLNNTLTSKCGCPDHFKWSPPVRLNFGSSSNARGGRGLGDRGVNKGNYIVQRNHRKKYTKFSVNKN